jgi:hypothetical protein
VSQAEGQGFDSLQIHFGGLAQLGERQRGTLEVMGSSPISSTSPTGSSAGEHLGDNQEVVGSNPTRSTTYLPVAQPG